MPDIRAPKSPFGAPNPDSCATTGVPVLLGTRIGLRAPSAPRLMKGWKVRFGREYSFRVGVYRLRVATVYNAACEQGDLDSTAFT